MKICSICVFLQDLEAEGYVKNELGFQEIPKSEICATTSVIPKVRLSNKHFLLYKNEDMLLYLHY